MIAALGWIVLVMRFLCEIMNNETADRIDLRLSCDYDKDRVLVVIKHDSDLGCFKAHGSTHRIEQFIHPEPGNRLLWSSSKMKNV